MLRVPQAAKMSRPSESLTMCCGAPAHLDRLDFAVASCTPLNFCILQQAGTSNANAESWSRAQAKTYEVGVHKADMGGVQKRHSALGVHKLPVVRHGGDKRVRVLAHLLVLATARGASCRARQGVCRGF